MPQNQDIERLISLLGKLPGLGPRSAQRAALHMMKKKDLLLLPLAEALGAVATHVRECATCGNFGTNEQCDICSDARRKMGQICVVGDVADLWAMERANAFSGRYHVLGGLLSALDGIGPEDLRIPRLIKRLSDEDVSEVILALNATVDGQTTGHYIADQLAAGGVQVTSLAQGVPIGGELDYLDEGTITTALAARKNV